jgi:hypothetical protein
MKENKNTTGMVRLLIILSILLALLGMVATVSADDGLPIPPNQFYGTVTIDGEPAPAGTEITAYIDDELSGSIEITTAGEYGYDLNYLGVTGSEADNGETITFKVSGSDETGNAVWVLYAKPRELNIGEPLVGATPTPTQDSPSVNGGIGTLPGALPTVTPDGATSAPDEGVTPDSPEATETSTEAPTSTTTDESRSGGLLTGYGLMLVIIVAIIGLLVVIYLGIRKRE